MMHSQKLPIEDIKDDIIETVRRNPIVVICGETGSGKTTQIPQYLLNAGINNDKAIAVTQPRRIAAVNMAKRVAKEMHCALGMEVGYEIRFDNRTDGSTKITFMTDGILLQKFLQDSYLNDYGVIMIDEAHERSVETDVILCMVKSLSKRRDDLRIVISSATMETEKFSNYFFLAPKITYPVKMFDVEVVYRPSYYEEYDVATVNLIKEIHKDWDGIEGDILAFLTGQEEIEKCCDALSGVKDLVVFPLYSALDYDAQQKVFERVDLPQRKAVIATNVAETSLTVDGVMFIIDCGYVKQHNFDPRMGISVLGNVPVSKAQANQRKGRAGRTSVGWCYRLYDEERFNALSEETKPEIHRINLSEVYLRLASLSIDPENFDFIDKPESQTLDTCKQYLMDLDLLDPSGKITSTGRLMTDFPVEPTIGKTLLASVDYHCSLDVVTILSMLTERNVFVRSRKWKTEADKCKAELSDSDGDHFTLLNVYEKWKENSKRKDWCHSNFINFKTMEKVDLVREQLISIMKQKRLPLESISNGADKSNIKKAFIEGFFKNICHKTSRVKYVSYLNPQETLYIHPGSCMFQPIPSQLIMYNEVIKTKKSFMHGVMSLTDSLLSEFPKQMDKIKYKSNLLDLSIFLDLFNLND